MKGSNMLVANKAKNFHQREMLWDTKGQYTKESNTLVGNAAKNFHQREKLWDTKRLYMKESRNTKIVNDIKNFIRLLHPPNLLGSIQGTALNGGEDYPLMGGRGSQAVTIPGHVSTLWPGNLHWVTGNFSSYPRVWSCRQMREII